MRDRVPERTDLRLGGDANRQDGYPDCNSGVSQDHGRCSSQVCGIRILWVVSRTGRFRGKDEQAHRSRSNVAPHSGFGVDEVCPALVPNWRSAGDAAVLTLQLARICPWIRTPGLGSAALRLHGYKKTSIILSISTEFPLVFVWPPDHLRRHAFRHRIARDGRVGSGRSRGPAMRSGNKIKVHPDPRAADNGKSWKADRRAG